MRTWLAATCFLLAQSAQVAAEPTSCPLTAVVVGADDDAREVSEELHLIGISSTRRDGCEAAEAHVSREGPRLAVNLRAPSGREESRTVSDAQIAATWIDSQLRGEAAAPLLAPRLAIAPGLTPEDPAPASPGASPNASPAIDEPEESATPERPRSALTVGLGFDSGHGDDASTWRSVRAALCAPIGPVCVGGMGRLGRGGASSSHDSYADDRAHAEALVSAAWPIPIGRVVLAPYAGVGAGALRVSRDAYQERCDDTPDLDPMTPPRPCPPAIDAETRTTIRGRAELGAVLSVPLADWLALDLSASYGRAFPGGGEREGSGGEGAVGAGGVPTPCPDDGECPPMTDPVGGTNDPEDEPTIDPDGDRISDASGYVAPFPIDPEGMLFFGIGLRVGGL